jgi:hypothetical protein
MSGMVSAAEGVPPASSTIACNQKLAAGGLLTRELQGCSINVHHGHCCIGVIADCWADAQIAGPAQLRLPRGGPRAPPRLTTARFPGTIGAVEARLFFGPKRTS